MHNAITTHHQHQRQHQRQGQSRASPHLARLNPPPCTPPTPLALALHLFSYPADKPKTAAAPPPAALPPSPPCTRTPRSPALNTQCNHCKPLSPRTPSTLAPLSLTPPIDCCTYLRTPPPATPANFPTSQQIDNPTNRKVGKLANTTNPKGQGRAAHQSPNAANPTTLHPAFLRSPYPGVNLKTTPCTHPLHPNPAPNLPPPAPSITCERTLHPHTLHQAH